MALSLLDRGVALSLLRDSVRPRDVQNGCLLLAMSRALPFFLPGQLRARKHTRYTACVLVQPDGWAAAMDITPDGNWLVVKSEGTYGVYWI